MTDQITLEEALQLVSFTKNNTGEWCVGIVRGNVLGTVCGGVGGHVIGNVGGHVIGNVGGNVRGTISGKRWAFIETPQEKLARLIKEKGDDELIKAFNEMEDSDD